VQDIVRYSTTDGETLAYVWLGSDERSRHFYFSFYTLDHVQQSLGLWLMLSEAQQAQQECINHLYLGTAYGEKGLYKTNFDPLEFWNGADWCADRTLLRSLCRADSSRTLNSMDIWKQDQDLF
jgi:hypothetical protein